MHYGHKNRERPSDGTVIILWIHRSTKDIVKTIVTLRWATIWIVFAKLTSCISSNILMIHITLGKPAYTRSTLFQNFYRPRRVASDDRGLGTRDGWEKCRSI